MKKKEIKKTKLKPRKKAEKLEGQFGVLMERMEHKFDLLSEGHLSVREDIKRLDKKIDNNHKEFKEFRNETNDNFKTLFKFRNETNSNFKTNFEYLSKIDDEIQSIKKEMAEMKNDMINDERIDPVKFFEIERRVGIVEEKLDKIPS